MTTIYLHIGMPKTGTTSLQQFLFENREKLLEKGYLYPIAGTDITSHRKPQRYSHNPLGRVLIQKNWVDKCGSWEELKSEINATRSKNVIVSAEILATQFRTYNPDVIFQIKEILENYNTKIIIYLRRQDDFLKSFYCFLITGGIRTDIQKFISEWKYMGDYYKTLEPWKDIFGIENIIVKIFEKKQMVNGDLVKDFLNAVNLDNEKIEWKFGNKKNVSVYSGKAIKFINLVDKLSQKNKAKKQIHKSYFIRRLILNTKTSKLMSYLPTNFIFTEELLSKEERIRIINEFEESNRKVAQEYLGREDGRLFYTSL